MKIDFNKHYLQKALQLAKELEGHIPSQNTEYDEVAFRARDFLASTMREMDKDDLKIVNQSINQSINQ